MGILLVELVTYKVGFLYSSELGVYAYAAAQVKKAIEVHFFVCKCNSLSCISGTNFHCSDL